MYHALWAVWVVNYEFDELKFRNINNNDGRAHNNEHQFNLLFDGFCFSFRRLMQFAINVDVCIYSEVFDVKYLDFHRRLMLRPLQHSPCTITRLNIPKPNKTYALPWSLGKNTPLLCLCTNLIILQANAQRTLFSTRATYSEQNCDDVLRERETRFKFLYYYFPFFQLIKLRAKKNWKINLFLFFLKKKAQWCRS